MQAQEDHNRLDPLRTAEETVPEACVHGSSCDSKTVLVLNCHPAILRPQVASVVD